MIHKGNRKHKTERFEDRSIDVWLCMECGLAFPWDSREIHVQGTWAHHTECKVKERAQLKRIGKMTAAAAEVLCRATRFRRKDTDLPLRGTSRAIIGERAKAPVELRKPTPMAVVPKIAALCMCGEPLVDGACPLNTIDWPHAVTG